MVPLASLVSHLISESSSAFCRIKRWDWNLIALLKRLSVLFATAIIGPNEQLCHHFFVIFLMGIIRIEHLLSLLTRCWQNIIWTNLALALRWITMVVIEDAIIDRLDMNRGRDSFVVSECKCGTSNRWKRRRREWKLVITYFIFGCSAAAAGKKLVYWKSTCPFTWTSSKHYKMMNTKKV